MKLLLILFSLTIFSVTTLRSAPRNPCTRVKNKREFSLHNVDAKNMESCYQSALRLLGSSKTRETGVKLMSRFLYIQNRDYRIGAILELGNSTSPKAIKPLEARGRHAVNKNNVEDAENVTSALINLKGMNAARNLVKYAKRKGKLHMTEIIRNEYLVYTSGREFEEMEKIAGKVIE